jgi:tetratricopeptide (TPR) repeat protein
VKASRGSIILLDQTHNRLRGTLRLLPGLCRSLFPAWTRRRGPAKGDTGPVSHGPCLSIPKGIWPKGLALCFGAIIALGLFAFRLEASAQDKRPLRDAATRAEAHYELGLVYHEQMFEFLDRAIAEYEKAIQLNPSFADAHFHLALAYHTKAKLGAEEKALYQKALKQYRLFLKFSPNGQLAEQARRNIKVLEKKLKE